MWVNQMIESAGGQHPRRPRGGRARAGADRARARGHGRALDVSAARRPGDHDLRGGPGAARVRGRQLGLHDQLPVRLSEREGERAGHLQGDEGGEVPARRPGHARAPRRSAGSTSASRPSPRTRTSPSRRSSAWSSPRTRSRPRSRAGCRRCARTSTTPRRSRRSIPASRRLIRESIDGRGAAPVRVARLPGPLAGDPERGPPDDRHRPRRPAGRPTTSCATSSSRRSTGRACCERRADRPTGARRRRRSPTGRRPSASSAWMLCAPAVIAMLLVTAYPIIYAVVLSVQERRPALPRRGRLRRASTTTSPCSPRACGGRASSTPSSSPSSRSRSSWCSG